MMSLSPSGRQAEVEGVEPPRPSGSLVFKTSSVAARMALPKPPRKESHLHRRVQSSSCSCYTTRDGQAGMAGLEPAARYLTGSCSTIELHPITPAFDRTLSGRRDPVAGSGCRRIA